MHTVLTAQDQLCVCGKGAVQATVSSLRVTFRLLGRACYWGLHSDLRMCNPCESAEVSAYVSGYSRLYGRAGHEAKAAVPMSREQLADLMSGMDSLAEEKQGRELLLLLRDQALFCGMGACGRRGGDLGKVCWRDLTTPDGAALDPAAWVPQAGDEVHCQMFSKTHQARRERLIRPFEYVDRPGERETNFLWRLSRYSLLRAESGFPWGSAGFLFSPQENDKRGFKESPLSGDACTKRLRAAVEKCGMDEGQTSHGFRRGFVQGLLADGLLEEEVMAVVGMRSPSTLALYSSTQRPLHKRKSPDAWCGPSV